MLLRIARLLSIIFFSFVALGIIFLFVYGWILEIIEKKKKDKNVYKNRD